MRGRTNVKAKPKIVPGSYQQLVNYLIMYDGGDAINVPSELHWRSYSQDLGYSTEFSPLKISFRYAGEVGYVSTEKYDLTDFVSAHLRITALNCNSVYSSAGKSAINGYLGCLDSQIVDGTSATAGSFGAYTSHTAALCQTDKYGNKTFIAEKDLSAITGNKHIAISAYCSQNGMATVGYVTFKYGVFVKADDWQTLCEKAGISATSIATLVADTTKLTTILASKDAVRFMIAQCTGNFMINAVESETFITALNDSPYKTLIQANAHWSRFLAMVA